jgi:N-terminal domain of toast_rack, DUF2154
MKARYLLLAPALLALTGCVIDTRRAGPVQYSSESVEMDDSEGVRVDLKMGAGDLRITDGGPKLMRGDFAYSVPSWKPEVRYSRTGKQASLTIEQPDKNHTRLGNTKYSWDLQLNKKVPVDLALHFGAGQARLDLGSLDLRGVELEMGVGQMDVDLRGAPKHSYNVGIHGGIGQATVRLLADTAVYVEAHGGIGSIQVRGLQQEEGHWVSPSYDRAENKIRIQIQGGIGEIKVVAD